MHFVLPSFPWKLLNLLKINIQLELPIYKKPITVSGVLIIVNPPTVINKIKISASSEILTVAKWGNFLSKMDKLQASNVHNFMFVE